MTIFFSAIEIFVQKAVLKNRKVLSLSLALLCLILSGCETGVYHTIKQGQTLYRIGHTYNVDEEYIARVNGIHDPTNIKIGSRVFIPGAKRRLYVPVMASKSNNGATTSTIKKTTAVVVPVKKVVKPKSKPTTTVSRQSVKKNATNVKQLKWPLRGKVVRSFSKTARAGGGKGIEIAVKSGSSVVAAEAGKVIYSGDGVDGYGFLIILQHENDFFTVYGFNRKNLIRTGDYVSKGEQIALSGTPPSGGKSRLHFEVRKGKIAVNPILYLP